MNNNNLRICITFQIRFDEMAEEECLNYVYPPKCYHTDIHLNRGRGGNVCVLLLKEDTRRITPDYNMVVNPRKEPITASNLNTY